MTISFNYETEFSLKHEGRSRNWINTVILAEGFTYSEINYVFCDDAYLHKLNMEFLNHDTFTDVISFDYTVGKILQGDVFISIERVQDNARELKVLFDTELHRVMVHGILHYCGYKDKDDSDSKTMRAKENLYLDTLSRMS